MRKRPIKVDRTGKRLKIGIWLDYRGSCADRDAANLAARGVQVAETLLQQDSWEVVVLAHRGGAASLTGLLAQYPGRLIIDTQEPIVLAPPQHGKLSTTYWANKAQRLLDRKAVKRERIYAKRALRRERVVSRRARAAAMLQASNVRERLRGLFGRLNARFSSLSVSASYRLQLLALALRAELARKIAKPEAEDPSFSFSVEPSAQERAAVHRCDAWIVPHPLLNSPLPARSLLLMTTGLVVDSQAEQALINDRKREAAQVMTWDAIGETLAVERIFQTATVGPAASELSALNVAASRQLVGEELSRRRYLLITADAAHREQLNKVLEGVAALDSQHGINDFHVVVAIPAATEFDGRALSHSGYCLGDRTKVIQVHGAVQLAALIRHSVAAVCLGKVGDEGPIYQALLQHRAVAAAAHLAAIPQLAGMGNALPRFDADRRESVVTALVDLLRCPDSLANRQQSLSGDAREFARQFNTERIVQACRDAATLPTAVRPPRKRIVLLQHWAYVGGVWQATRNLVQSLAEINRERGDLDIVLAVLPEQTGCEEFQRVVPDVRIVRVRPVEVPRSTVERLGQQTKRPRVSLEHESYLFFEGENGEMLEADAWLAVIDRFHKCLAPLRPYSVLIHDMIQRGVPSQFDCPAWRSMVADGMRPSARAAQVVLTTTSATAHEVMDEYEIPAAQMRVVPLAHDPVRRFRSIASKPVPEVNGPFVLNVANHASHKGAEVLLRAIGLWKQRPEWRDWKLVICGYGTRLFSPDNTEEVQGDHVPKMRQLVRDLGLIEGRDVVFMDYIDDHQLKDLFERSDIVINAARYDNGSYSMIEGTWFGKPVVSSRYPGAEYVDRRFGVGAHFFRVQDPVDLVRALDAARASLTMPAAQRAARAQYAVREEVGLERFGERLYDILSRLAGQDEAMPLFEELQSPTSRAA